ncbi:hypothetical protein FRACA_540010 [Frankia canadensis]|uniref:DUF4037 domain-containing protein n=1 Tax=Frankia canadensis TaxID=1836972 RepID=A0A2I2KYT1_9ACTN|nr:hypothetical protein FRACA_540010 [Frankia canadensis]SOU58114.1 hypothetical protein FRACA_540010 [Frankia canadensis]
MRGIGAVIRGESHWAVDALDGRRRRLPPPRCRRAGPTQIPAGITGGVVLHDPFDLLTARRRAWHPNDIRPHALASGWRRVSQEEPPIGRRSTTPSHERTQFGDPTLQ